MSSTEQPIEASFVERNRRWLLTAVVVTGSAVVAVVAAQRPDPSVSTLLDAATGFFIVAVAATALAVYVRSKRRWRQLDSELTISDDRAYYAAFESNLAVRFVSGNEDAFDSDSDVQCNRLFAVASARANRDAVPESPSTSPKKISSTLAYAAFTAQALEEIVDVLPPLIEGASTPETQHWLGSEIARATCFWAAGSGNKVSFRETERFLAVMALMDAGTRDVFVREIQMMMKRDGDQEGGRDVAENLPHLLPLIEQIMPRPRWHPPET